MGSTLEPGVWLIFADSGGIGQELISSLEGRGEICIKILQGETYRALDNGVYYLDPTRVEDFQKLLNDVFENGRSTCRGLAHMWCLDAREAGETTLESLVSAQERYCGSVLHLIQALAKTGSGDLPRLWLMTGGVQPIGTEIESISIAQSPIWGLGKVITHEHSELRCARVDLSHKPGQREIESLCNELLSDDDEDQITLRGNERYVARLANRPPKAEVKSAQHVLRGDATYLITGGLGGLGLTVARWMVNQGVRHLALAGRNGSSKNTEPALDEMRNAGVEILVVKADAADSVQVKEMLAQIDGSMPPLRGIIHAAGVLDDGILLQQDLQRFRHVMAPKIEGAWNVHSQTLDRELDLFVLFSSAASMLGTPGQGNYAAANSFLDALAHHRRAQGKPALSINWGAWLDVGLAAAESNRGERLALRGMSGITPEQGVEALGQLLDSQSVQTGVMALNLRQWRQSYPKIAGSPLFVSLRRAVLTGL
jgi:NAD(P)-dependent dehydrogenase (short-subunit alcohol dehydrogenase family)